MSSATERLNTILLDLPKKKSQWQLNVTNPYVRSYELAYNNFQKTLKDQASRDQMAAELFVFAASVLSGSALMAAFATTSLRVLAGRAMLRTICNNNLNRTFDAVHATANSKTAMFALGSVMDKAKSVAGKQITAAIEGFTKSAPVAQSQTALNFLTRMDDFVNVNHICVHEFVANVRDDSSIKDSDKIMLAGLVETTPFWQAPTSSRIDENRLSQKMELLFYMSSVLDSDTLVLYAPAIGAGAGSGSGEAIYSKKPISQMPSAANYPKPTMPKHAGGLSIGFEPGQRVEYGNLGSSVRERIDMLSRIVVGTPFYPEQNVALRVLGNDPTGSGQMIKAEQIITRLSMQTRPKQLNDVLML
jgi:hypothetical protein